MVAKGLTDGKSKDHGRHREHIASAFPKAGWPDWRPGGPESWVLSLGPGQSADGQLPMADRQSPGGKAALPVAFCLCNLYMYGNDYHCADGAGL